MSPPRNTLSHGKRLTFSGNLSAGQQLGRYQVLGELAAGGMAVVHVASAHGAAGFERLVALKVLHSHLACEEEFIKMFLDEARLAAGIRHPNVVSTIDISDSVETGYFLVMEYVEGDHLGALLSAAHKRGSRLPLPVVMRIVIDALAGLSAAHELRDPSGKPLQLVHRDVSPHNVMVGTDGVSRLTDFGVAKAEDRLTQTRHGEVKGKLSYMAPEQASSGVSDRRSDLFSMGIILWEAVTGRRLFRADTVSATLAKLLSDTVAPPSAIDPKLAPLDALLRKALAHAPDQRFSTAEEFSDALEATANQMTGVASWRTVSDAVQDYAAEKLVRERKLIAAAKQTLQGLARMTLDPEEPVVRRPVKTVSFENDGISRGEPSGVFSNLTAPGRPRKTRSVEVALPVSIEFESATPPGGALPAASAEKPTPPPLGHVAPTTSRSRTAVATKPMFARRHLPMATIEALRNGRGRRTALALGACALLLVGGWVWLRNSDSPRGPAAELATPDMSSTGTAPARTRAVESRAHLVAPKPPASAPRSGAAVAAAPNSDASRAKPLAATPVRRVSAPARSSRPQVANRAKRTRKAPAATTSVARAPAARAPASRLLPNPYKR